MYFTHSLAGAITTKVVLNDKEEIFSKIEKNILWFVGITASVLPDFDLILYFFIPNLGSHREWLSHSAVPYSILSLALFIFGFLSKKREKFGRQFYMSLASVFVFGIITHLVLDYFVGGLALFLPFSRHVYGYEMECIGDQNWIVSYITSGYMLVEGVILGSFVLFYKSIKNKLGKALALFYVGLATFASVAINLFVH